DQREKRRDGQCDLGFHWKTSLLDSRFACSGTNWRMSPGWHKSASQIASSVEKRIARALPVLRIDKLASVIPTRSASSVSVIRRSWSRSSSLTAIAMSNRPLEVFAHERAFREHAGQQERENYCEPAADRKAGIEMEGMYRTRNGLADRADDQAKKL